MTPAYRGERRGHADLRVRRLKSRPYGANHRWGPPPPPHPPAARELRVKISWSFSLRLDLKFANLQVRLYGANHRRLATLIIDD